MTGKKQNLLNPKQLRFVKEYCVDLNGTQAAIRAGFSKKTAQEQSSRLLSKVIIQEEIKKEQSKIEGRIEITQDKVAQEMARVAFADMADFVKIDESGMIQANPLDTLLPGQSRVIRKVKEHRTIKSDEGEDTILNATYEFELHDKMKGLEQLGRHLGMFKDKMEVSIDGALAAMAAKVYAKNGKGKEKHTGTLKKS
jgi:phage terminase small subunit